MEQISRLFDLLDYSISGYNKKVALSGKKSGEWVNLSGPEWKEQANLVALSLIDAGISVGDNIATLSNSRPEWSVVDMGIMLAGCVHVPINPSVSESDLIFILNEAEVSWIFVANKYLYNKVRSIAVHAPLLKTVCSFDHINGAFIFSDMLRKASASGNIHLLESRKAEVDTDDVATIIYTSGTTNRPKGVMLTHRNIIDNVTRISGCYDICEGTHVLSYLPLSHILERSFVYMYVYLGMSVYFAESLGGITGNFADVKPGFMTTVPLLLEKTYGAFVESGRNLTGFKRMMFNFAHRVAETYPINGKPSLWYRMKQQIADAFVFCKWKRNLGGRLKTMVCGGAALQEKILCAYWAMGIKVLEGYGLTETSPVISNNHSKNYRLGTIGKILEGVDVKIADDGEILVKGSTVMKGYYKNPDVTAEVIDADGYFHTGDIGIIVDGCFLKITGRKKDVFKTSSGMYVSPESIENKLKQTGALSYAFVTGANKNFLVALLIPEPVFLQAWCSANGVTFENIEEVISDDKVIAFYSNLIEDYNRFVFETEMIGRFALLHDCWGIETGEMTPKMSLKRGVIELKYRQIIDRLYYYS
ncbi:MAG: long-chain fatty acid--CoA ligase [Bacteroidota bacterium]